MNALLLLAVACLSCNLALCQYAPPAPPHRGGGRRPIDVEVGDGYHEKEPDYQQPGYGRPHSGSYGGGNYGCMTGPAHVFYNVPFILIFKYCRSKEIRLWPSA